MSLDGRIAGPNHDLSFPQTLSGGPGGYGYDEFIAEIDGLAVGAGSWDFMKDYPWTYGERPIWVMTHRDDVPSVEGAEMHVFSGEVVDLVRELESSGLKRVWVIGGGDVVGQFLAADRLDEVIVTVARPSSAVDRRWPTASPSPALRPGQDRAPRGRRRCHPQVRPESCARLSRPKGG